MNVSELLKRFGSKEVAKAGIIGGGAYATAIVTQSVYTKNLDIVAVGDLSAEVAKQSFLKAGIAGDRIAVCSSLGEARLAALRGDYVATGDPELLFRMNLNVVAEATGHPEAGAKHAALALKHGIHLVMINKETDSVIGPYLHVLFENEGLVYTPVDGDQPAQLMQLVDWARMIGLRILCAGKARDGEFLYDPEAGTVTLPADGKGVPKPVTVSIAPGDRKYLGFIPEGKTKEYMRKRAELLAGLPGPGGFDYCELVNIANSTGLRFDASGIKAGALRVNELPIAYALEKNGGLLGGEETIDIFTLLRTKEEASMGGGVFLVVRSDNAYSQHILLTKTLLGNYDGSAAVMVQPYHLCGVESSTSLTAAALLGVHTGGADRALLYDIARVARKDLPAGTKCTHDRDPNLETIIVPAGHRAPKTPVPAHLVNGHLLNRAVKKGETITYDMVTPPADSLLWKLRLEAEQHFLEGKTK
jgi:predicted homoserine dehydrogenase-like protein